MSAPDSRNHNPDPEYIRRLVLQIGLTKTEIARRLGVTPRWLRMVIAGYRIMEGRRRAVSITYPEQYALEQMLAHEKRKAKRRTENGK